MSQAKLTHVQTLREETKTIHNDLNAEMLALSKITREGLLMTASRVVALEHAQRLLVAALLAMAVFCVLKSLGA